MKIQKIESSDSWIIYKCEHCGNTIHVSGYLADDNYFHGAVTQMMSKGKVTAEELLCEVTPKMKCSECGKSTDDII